MAQIKTLDDLKKMREQMKTKTQLRMLASDADKNPMIKVAMATCGIASGAKIIMEYLIDELEKRNITAIVKQTGCMGYCYAEPTIEVTLPGSEPVVFGQVDIKKADEIIEKYIKNGDLVDGIIPQTYKSAND